MRDMKKSDHRFEGFCIEVVYPLKLEKIMQSYYHIMSQLPHDMGEEDRMNLDSPEPDVELEEKEEEDHPKASTWVSKGNKRQKVVHMPKKVKERTLKLMHGRIQYFSDMRQNSIQQRVKVVENSSTSL